MTIITGAVDNGVIGGGGFGPYRHPEQVYEWHGGDIWTPVLDLGLWEDAMPSVGSVSDNEKKVTEWLGWDEDQGQAWESDDEAAQRLLEELGERGYRVEPAGSNVTIRKGKAAVAWGNGRHLKEALVKAVVRLAA